MANAMRSNLMNMTSNDHDNAYTRIINVLSRYCHAMIYRSDDTALVPRQPSSSSSVPPDRYTAWNITTTISLLLCVTWYMLEDHTEIVNKSGRRCLGSCGHHLRSGAHTNT